MAEKSFQTTVVITCPMWIISQDQNEHQSNHIQHKEVNENHLFTWYIEVRGVEVLPGGDWLTLLVLRVPVLASEGEQKNP